jgi:flavin reductase (DIM6/NTAB) family NADH-FMN oxidoreductase RutF
MVETISHGSFRHILSQFASGVTVVGVAGPRGPAGFTATGFMSASLVPPLVLVCIDKSASVYDAVVTAEAFGVSILEASQAWIAGRFAQSDIDRFEGVAFRLGQLTRAPLIEGALAQLECRRQALHDVGDHTLVVGEVAGGFSGAGRPLGYFARRFGTFTTEEPDGATRP